MSQNLYTITSHGMLRYYRHTGRGRLVSDWNDPKIVGSDWDGFNKIFDWGGGMVYGIQPNGDLLWYYHDDRNQGSAQWQGPSKAGNG